MPDNTERNANDFDLTELNEDSIEALCSQLSNKDQITLKTAFEKRHESNLRVEEGTDIHNALSVVMRVSKIKYDPKISTSRGKEYTPDLLPTYIKYVYEDFTASEMRQIGLNLIFNSNLDRNQILEWCLHLANHVPAKYLSEDEFASGWKNVETINKISIMEGSKKRDLKKVLKPSFEGLLSVEALKSNFEKENSDQADHEQRAWFRMKDNEIVCYFPVLFFSVLRSRMGISEINYINRLKRVNGILSIIHYSENQILTLPDDHIFYKNIFIEKRQAEMNDKIQDIMAKCIYLFVKSENIELGLICGSLVARNAAYMGLSHYAMYKVLYDSIPEGARDWIIPACRVPNRKGEHENFVQLLLTISKVKDDEFWPFIRAVDTTVFGQYSTRNCISTVLSLAVLCDSIIKSGDDSESAYAGYVEVYKDRLDQRHIAYLNKMISYFKSEIENASSTCPMPSKLKSKGISVRKEGESSKTSKRVRSTSRSNRSRSRSRSGSRDKASDSEDEDNFEELFSKSD